MIVTGGRNFSFYSFIASTLTKIHRERKIEMLVSGMAAGADSGAVRWAKDNGIPICPHYAKWKLHGRSAGPKRNQEMAEHHPDAILIAYPGGAGTNHMKRVAKKAGIKVLEFEPEGYPPC